MKRQIILAEIKITPPSSRTDEALRDGESDIMEVSVSYKEGGRNYFTGGFIERGYYISATPMRVGDGFKSMVIDGRANGVTQLIQSAGRYNANTLKKLAAAASVNHPVVEAAMARCGCRKLEVACA